MVTAATGKITVILQQEHQQQVKLNGSRISQLQQFGRKYKKEATDKVGRRAQIE
jgi:hypothetical protein